MNKQKNILLAFVLNLLFSVFELVGGVFTGSVAILSDAVHDVGDAVGIGISYFCERRSRNKPDDIHTYGYIRYSVLGGLITTVILLFGSFGVVYQAVLRLWNPVPIRYNGMILFAIIGVLVNGLAAYFTRDGHSVNQRAVNLHMLEDVLGWIVVLIGALVMRFTDFYYLDAILSLGVAVFILIHAFKTMKSILDIFLEKTPKSINMDVLRKQIMRIEGVKSIRCLHIRSLDGFHHDGTVGLIVAGNDEKIKQQLRELLKQHNVIHTVIEIDNLNSPYNNDVCTLGLTTIEQHHHNHHH